MRGGTVAGGEPSADFVGIVMEGTHAAAIGDTAGFVNDIEALGPRGVGVVRRVVHVVDAESDGIVESLDEVISDGNALGKRFRLGVADVILDVGLHFPLVSWMGFANVHGEKVGMFLVVVVNLDHVTDVAAEGRSSVAAEDDDERASAGAFADVEVS